MDGPARHEALIRWCQRTAPGKMCTFGLPFNPQTRIRQAEGNETDDCSEYQNSNGRIEVGGVASKLFDERVNPMGDDLITVNDENFQLQDPFVVFDGNFHPIKDPAPTFLAGYKCSSHDCVDASHGTDSLKLWGVRADAFLMGEMARMKTEREMQGCNCQLAAENETRQKSLLNVTLDSNNESNQDIISLKEYEIVQNVKLFPVHGHHCHPPPQPQYFPRIGTDLLIAPDLHNVQSLRMAPVFCPDSNAPGARPVPSASIAVQSTISPPRTRHVRALSECDDNLKSGTKTALKTDFSLQSLNDMENPEDIEGHKAKEKYIGNRKGPDGRSSVIGDIRRELEEGKHFSATLISRPYDEQSVWRTAVAAINRDFGLQEHLIGPMSAGQSRMRHEVGFEGLKVQSERGHGDRCDSQNTYEFSILPTGGKQLHRQSSGRDWENRGHRDHQREWRDSRRDSDDVGVIGRPRKRNDEVDRRSWGEGLYRGGLQYRDGRRGETDERNRDKRNRIGKSEGWKGDKWRDC